MSSNSPLVLCAPNFSEGRNFRVMKAILDSIRKVKGIQLLDWSHDRNHNRMVVSFLGPPKAVTQAAFLGAAKAVEWIDLNRHSGEHPRIGAVDVIPLIPIRDITVKECASLAHELGKRLYEKLKLPVYFYEAAAKKPSRKNLAEVRKGNYDALRLEISKKERRPDIGDPKLHPTAGAVAVGARPFLVAFNVNLQSKDVRIARKIAAKIREAGGGLKNVKALGIRLSDCGLTQVSMNLTDCSVTPIHVAFEAVCAEADRLGVEIAGSEIVGVVPLRYLVDSFRYFLKLENFQISQLLETHLS